MMRSTTQRSEQGSVVLVALCFVAVLGIALGSYLAVSNQAMKLSNRGQQKSVSRQLADMGLEQALWSFNRNNWDPTVWTIDAPNHRATRTVTFPNTKYGNGVKGSINLRIDNYDAYYQPSVWATTASPPTYYQPDDLVAYTDGMWYRCLQANQSSATNAPGNLGYWAPAPIPWKWNANTLYTKASSAPPTGASVIFSGSSWYYCTTNSSGAPLSLATNWTVMPAPPSFSWNSITTYPANTFVYDQNVGQWYRSTISNSGNEPPGSDWVTGDFSWAYQPSITYHFNDVVYCRYNGVDKWYRCVASSSTNQAGLPPDWTDALSSWGWSSTMAYNLNDVVTSGGNFYRCVLANSNQVPPNSTYWSNAPLLSSTWNAGRQYNLYDTSYSNGTWYLSLQNVNIGKYPVISSDAATGYWAPAPQSISAWDPTKNYNPNDLVSFGGSWYRCVAAHINQQTTNAAYWAIIIGASYQWDPTIPYSPGSYVSYSGVWYLCKIATTATTPNNSASWIALGSAVIYAEGVTALPDNSAPIKTQLRATATRAPLFPNAAAASSTLMFSTDGLVDSYDGTGSFLYNQNTPPFSPSNSNISYSAVIAGENTTGTAVTLTGNVTVQGYVAAPSQNVSPYAPLFTPNANAVVKGVAATPSPKIDLSRISRSPYIPQFDFNIPSGGIPLPFVSGSGPMTIGTPGSVAPETYTFTSGDLYLNVATDVITVAGPVILNIQGSLRIRYGQLIIASTGSAEIHFTDRLRVYNTGQIINATKDPKKLTLIRDNYASAPVYHYFRTPSSTSSFYGTIYLPNDTLTVDPNVEIYGAVSTGTLTFGGTINFHYDTSLRYTSVNGVDAPFILSQWRELTDPAEKIVLP